jgi:hypothetical protein
LGIGFFFLSIHLFDVFRSHRVLVSRAGATWFIRAHCSSLCTSSHDLTHPSASLTPLSNTIPTT